jgi:putative molybdopterin biosynthesis protein
VSTTERQEIALFKVLGHPERYAILRRLMATQATLSQLGQAFDRSPAHIRHHLKLLERAGLVEFVGERRVQGGSERYYRASQRALFIHRAVLPETPREKFNITIGSMDPALRRLADSASRTKAPFYLSAVPLSSLDGLIALRQGLCQMSTCHLLDPGSEQYNRSFVRHLFPGEPMSLVQFFRREEGLILRPDNPLGITSLEDVTRPDVRFVNREPGSGVRQWLDLQLDRLGIPAETISGFSDVVHSHHAVARAIAEGRADVGVGIAISAEVFGLHFIPLFEEPYEIVAPLSLVSDERYAPFFDYLNSAESRTALRALDGYVVPQNSGRIEVIR